MSELQFTRVGRLKSRQELINAIVFCTQNESLNGLIPGRRNWKESKKEAKSSYCRSPFHLQFPLSIENLVPDCSLHTVSRHDDLKQQNQLMRLLSSLSLVSPPSNASHHVLFIPSPFLKDLQRLAGVQHARCGKHHLETHNIIHVNRNDLSSCWHVQPNTCHGSGVVSVRAVKGLDVLELKHVSLYERFSDFLVGPCNEKLVIVISFFCQSSGEVDWCLQVHSLPGWRQVTLLNENPLELNASQCISGTVTSASVEILFVDLSRGNIKTYQNVSNRMQSSCALPKAKTGIST